MKDIGSIKLKATQISKKYGLDMIVLFGSQADGTATKKSDVDIAYAASEPLSFETQLSIGSELAPLFGTEAADVVHLNKTSPAFMYQIMKNAIPLSSSRPGIFQNFFSYAIKRLHENMFLYDLKFDRLAKEYGI
jgi:predicted nucleotidyltransferase